MIVKVPVPSRFDWTVALATAALVPIEVKTYALVGGKLRVVIGVVAVGALALEVGASNVKEPTSGVKRVFGIAFPVTTYVIVIFAGLPGTGDVHFASLHTVTVIVSV